MEAQAHKQPLSLKWKWSILLSVAFMLIGSGALMGYSHYARHTQYNAQAMQSERLFLGVIDYFQKMNQPLVKEIFDQEGIQQEELHYFIQHAEKEELLLRVYNDQNVMLYETKSISLPNNTFVPNQIQRVEVDNQTAWATHVVLSSPTLQRQLGTLELLHLPKSFDEGMARQQQLFWKLAALVALLSVGLAIVLTHYFLMPLNYLNNILDLVEEESLSEIRMRHPKSNDEWSDLNIHINRLLDKIDLFVRNQKQFVEDVSHELRTPVAIVEGHLKLLNRWGKNDPEVLEESISASLQEITRMKELVQEMLDLSRADHVEADYKNEVTEVYSTVLQVYNNFVMLYPNFKFYLDSERDGRELFIKMYRNHFEQILIILLDNAVKYSRDRHEIHVAVSTTFTKVEIAIQDFGEGMSEEDKERVFGRFYRVDKARSRNKGGNGLGLSIAKQLVEGYKGKIRVESVLNHGSIFYIEFPVMSDLGEIAKHKKKVLNQSVE